MKMLQYTGPFTTSDTIKISSAVGYEYVHIGVQIPQRQPIARQAKKTSLRPDINTVRNAVADRREEDWSGYDNDTRVDLSINGVAYRVSDGDILEFDEIDVSSWEIAFKDDLPWGTIIDIMYDESKI